jgi:hypothetical protein
MKSQITKINEYDQHASNDSKSVVGLLRFLYCINSNYIPTKNKASMFVSQKYTTLCSDGETCASLFSRYNKHC